MINTTAGAHTSYSLRLLTYVWWCLEWWISMIWAEMTGSRAL